jgi:phosphoribosylformylglycinamidine synthase PurS subunit
MKVRVLIRLKREVPDSGGELVQARLVDMGYSEVKKVALGRLLEIDLETSDADIAEERTQRMCNELLVNSLIEDFEISVED